MTHLESDVIENGGDISLNTKVTAIERKAGGGYNVIVQIEQEKYLLEADVIVNRQTPLFTS